MTEGELILARANLGAVVESWLKFFYCVYYEDYCAIHSFRYRDIGTPQDFLDDVDYLYKFVDNVLSHLPPIEDYIEVYPAGYVMNIYFE